MRGIGDWYNYWNCGRRFYGYVSSKYDLLYIWCLFDEISLLDIISSRIQSETDKSFVNSGLC